MQANKQTKFTITIILSLNSATKTLDLFQIWKLPRMKYIYMYLNMYKKTHRQRAMTTDTKR